MESTVKRAAGGGGGCQCRGPALFVGPKEPGDFGAQQLDEGAREHLFGLLRRVPEVVLGMSKYIKQGFNQLLVLEKGTEGPHTSHDRLKDNRPKPSEL